MKNFRNIFTTKRNNFRFFLQLSVFALLGIMSLFSGQISARTPTPTPTPTPGQGACIPGATMTEGDLLPGGIVVFNVLSGPGSVAIKHLDAGSGLQSLTLVGMPTNAIVNIPAFTLGTTSPVTVTFTTPNPGYMVDFTLRAASESNSVNIRVRCAEICTPSATVSEGDLFPGNTEFFGVTTRPGSVTVDHIDDGTGIQSLTLVGAMTNAIVNIPVFTVGTFSPIRVTFTPIDPTQELKFTLRVANTFHAAFISVRCGTPPSAQLAEDDSK